MAPESVIFRAPQSVNTPTSPNTNVVTTPTGDVNNTTNFSFQYQGRIPVWTPFVSQASQTAVLGRDITIGSTTWKEGITVQYAALGSTQYTATIISGTLKDASATYDLAGVTLGIFPISAASAETETRDVPDEDDLPLAKFNAPSSVNTPTTPNTNVVTTPTGDTNNTTNLSFQYQGRIPIWTPFVSQASQKAVLEGSIKIGSTVWQEGITVQYAALGSTQYTVTIVSGFIEDDSTLYDLAGVTLGIFPINPG